MSSASDAAALVLALALAAALAVAAAGCGEGPRAEAAPPMLDLAAGTAPVDELAAFNPAPADDGVADDGSDAAGDGPADGGPAVLRACADPNNLPYSNARLEGFENELIALVARDLGMDTAWTWFPQRRGFARKTLRAGRCDVIAGVPSSYELALTTAPYYRSTYVFVTRADRGLDIRSLDDPRLRSLRVGLHVVGDDYSNTPGAAALARRGLVENVVGYSIYGDYSQPDPPARLIEAVAAGEIDLAIAWGPIAGFFAARQDTPLRLAHVTPRIDPPFTLFVYDMSMAVRRGADSLKVALEEALRRRAPEVRTLLERYHVPVVETGARGARGAASRGADADASRTPGASGRRAPEAAP